MIRQSSRQFPKVVFFDIGNTIVGKKQWLPGAKEFIAALKAKNVRVGLLSNTGDMDRESLEKLLPEDFDFGYFEESLVMLSSETGVEKPKLGAFSLAVQHSNCSPWETMFLGETVEETYMAQMAGMHAVRITDPANDFKTLKKLLVG